MITANARSAAEAGASFEATKIERRDLEPNDVLIDIAYAGICHSDIHTARNEWGEAMFPLVPGHEIAGTISAIGSGVTKYKVGDRVGVGCFVDSCRECDNCKAQQQQYCDKGATFTYNAIDKYGRPTAGGYSDKIVVDENYTIHIPDSIGLDVAAPLLCAGITLYSPLKRWGAGPGKRVAIVGFGGLGHMGVKIASAMGAHVTVLSQSLKKQEDGLRFGASEYFATSDPTTFEHLAKKFDLIVSTLSANVDIAQYLGLLKLDGTMVNVGAPENPLSVPPMALIGRRASLAGSLIGGIAETQEMLDFCGKHGIGAEVEVIRGDQITNAYDRVVASDIRYRFVIDTSTITA